jgi:hypothetical protein
MRKVRISCFFQKHQIISQLSLNVIKPKNWVTVGQPPFGHTLSDGSNRKISQSTVFRWIIFLPKNFL